jgi:hypothetical protein
VFDETPSKAVKIVEMLPAELAPQSVQILLPFSSAYMQLVAAAETE